MSNCNENKNCCQSDKVEEKQECCNQPECTETECVEESTPTCDPETCDKGEDCCQHEV